MGSAVLNNTFRVIDQYAAGHIGTAAQAAIGSCVFVLIANYGLHLMVAGGVGPLVARAVGRRDAEEVRRAVTTALVTAIAVATCVGVVQVAIAPWIAAGLGLTGETHADAVTFLRVILGLGAPLALGPVVDAVLIAHGRTREMMALQLLAAALNLGLNSLLVVHLGWGVAGTALATVLGRSVTSGAGVLLLARTIGLGRFDRDILRRVLRVGAPASTNHLAYATVYFLLLRWAISPLGPSVNAGLGIGFSALEGFTYPLFFGMSVAVSSVVGRRLGAGEIEEAKRAGRLALPWATGLGLGAASLFYFGGETLCAWFTHDPDTLREAILYAHILAASQLAVAWEALAEGVLQGAGDTRTVFWLGTPMNALRVPIAWALAFPGGWGAAGVWWAINFTSFGKALGKGAAALRGRWVRTRV